ncbi:TPA: restriction endonuclease subunit S [Vibrio cholerae]|uniref:restriction endonuclease subunit S n=1 Tax=Vibrio cholerae TaxID=666 RepID=UPI0028DAA88D|nr:restriction endonuclease subunit S [Vibrio cholerae]
MPKYEAYKDSGVEWLGDIPSSWELKPGFVAFSENKRNNKGMKENTVLSLSYGNIVVKPEEKLVGLVPESFETYQLVEPDDIIVRCTDLQNDKVSLRTGLAKNKGIITSAYLNLRVKNGFDARFLHYYLHALDTTKVLYKFGSGLRQNLSFLDFKRLPIFEIPEDTQKLIANYLEKKTAQVDDAIAIKEQQISLLKERKQIIIQQAVTQGLDPNVPMKDSGVDWIGKIPAHWGCTAVKRLLDIPITDGPHTTPQLHDEGIPFISAEAIKGGEINFDKKRGYINEKDYLLFSNKYTPKVNDIYMVKSGATTGRVAIVRTEMKFTIWSPLAVFRVDKNKLNPLYLYYFLQSYSFLKGVELSWSFGTQQNIGMGVLGNLFALAPPLEEQQLIVNSIEPHFREIDIASEQVYQQIEKLKEYKTTLINSAVTGKIKITPEMVEQ